MRLPVCEHPVAVSIQAFSGRNAAENLRVLESMSDPNPGASLSSAGAGGSGRPAPGAINPQVIIDHAIG